MPHKLVSVRIRVGRRSTIALAAAAALASTGTVYVGARNLLSGQADQARRVIPKSWDIPPRADGVYSPGGGPVERWHRGVPFDLHLMVFGDSTATGYGCRDADELPGVLIARGLAEESGKRIRLSTKAIVGATSKGLSGQIDAMFVAGPPPDAAVIMIGANDITSRTASDRRRADWAGRSGDCGQRGRRRGRHVSGLRRHQGDPAAAALGGPQPRIAAGPCAGLAVRSAGGVPVPFSDLLAREFPRRRNCCSRTTCSTRRAPATPWRPSSCCLRSCNALGDFIGHAEAEEALESRSPEGSSLLARLGGVSRLWRRSTGVPAPIVVPAS